MAKSCYQYHMHLAEIQIKKNYTLDTKRWGPQSPAASHTTAWAADLIYYYMIFHCLVQNDLLYLLQLFKKNSIK